MKDWLSTKLFLFWRRSKSNKSERNRKPQFHINIGKFSRESLLYLSIVFSIIGILFLFLLSAHIQPRHVSISQIRSLSDGAYIRTAGFVFEINESKFKICEAKFVKGSECVTVLSHGTVPLFIFDGDHVFVTGTVRVFNNRTYVWISGKDSIERME